MAVFARWPKGGWLQLHCNVLSLGTTSSADSLAPHLASLA
jgi:hypothetical protein